MPHLIRVFTIIACLVTATPALAGVPPLNTEILPGITAALERYRVEQQHLDTQLQVQLRDIERDYYLKLNSLKMEMPPPLKSKGLFETTEEFKARMIHRRESLEKIRENNQRALTQMEHEGGLRIQVAETELSWLKTQLRKLAPMAETITRLQQEGCRVAGDMATITVQRPNADAFRFPVTINHNGTLYRDTWTYPDRDKAETVWQRRHELKVYPRYSPEPLDEGGIGLRLNAFVVTGPQDKTLIEFPMEKPVPFDAVTRLEQIQSEDLPAARILLALTDTVEGPLPGMRFVFVSPRPFAMGSPKGTPGRVPDEALHNVSLKRPFYMQTTEVTQAQWEAIMGYNPSAFAHCGADCPVENIYWQDALRFITKLNALYKGKGRFRLPTEAEWEYVARTGTADPWVRSETDATTYAWFRNNAGGSPHAVATRHSNLWNIYDMNGNVAEWCSDWYGPYPDTHLSESPRGPLDGEFRVSRGGSWYHGIDTIRGAHRNSDSAGDKSDYTGFRLVLEIPLSTLRGSK